MKRLMIQPFPVAQTIHDAEHRDIGLVLRYMPESLIASWTLHVARKTVLRYRNGQETAASTLDLDARNLVEIYGEKCLCSHVSEPSTAHPLRVELVRSIHPRGR